VSDRLTWDQLLVLALIAVAVVGTLVAWVL
jgi:hypothetical protein